MDHQIVQYIQQKDIPKIVAFFKNNDEKKNRIKHITNCIDYFCQNHLSSNLWILKFVSSKLKEAEYNADMKHIIEMLVCFCQIPEKQISNRIKYVRHIDHIISENKLFEYNSNNMSDLDRLIQEKTNDPKLFHWMMFFKNCVQYNDPTSIEFIRCIFEHRKRFILFDCIFLVIESIQYISTDVKEYISLAKELFYHRTTKTQKDNRKQLIIYATTLCIKNRTSYVPYQIKPIQTDSKFDYLFMLTYEDKEAIEKTRQEKKSIVINNNHENNIRYI